MDNKIMTPIAWADHTCKPNKSRNTPELMQQYADYYAREVGIRFSVWCSGKRLIVSNENADFLFDQFINDQKKVTPIDNDLK